MDFFLLNLFCHSIPNYLFELVSNSLLLFLSCLFSYHLVSSINSSIQTLFSSSSSLQTLPLIVAPFILLFYQSPISSLSLSPTGLSPLSIFLQLFFVKRCILCWHELRPSPFLDLFFPTGSSPFFFSLLSSLNQSLNRSALIHD